MTREELKAHCERQIAKCEAIYAEDDKMLNSNSKNLFLTRSDQR